MGSPIAPVRAFQTMTRLDAGGGPTAEAMHYAYYSDGKLEDAAFAQTPAVASGQGYVPASGAPWYDVAHPASRRVRAHYRYDPAGRPLSVAYYGEAYQGQSGFGGYRPDYAETGLFENDCAYELSGLNRGLKTQSAFTMANVAMNGYASWTESYGYDASLDYLTSASYGDGNPNPTQSWSYDAAGNRSDAAVDNLNRPTSVGGAACASDILGNRLAKGATTYEWDCLNRLTAHRGGGGLRDGAYRYRADGMRTLKVIDPAGQTYNGALYTRFRYDGQMGIEDWETQGGYATLYRYGLGARGIDVMDRQAIYPEGPQPNVRVFPVYDAHGNTVATISRDGQGGFSLNDRRSFDAWGVVRSEQHGNDPRLRYCGSLGHKADDESGLVYMRARYYEPTSGRFISEDPERQGRNCFSYCGSDPVNRCDEDGQWDTKVDVLLTLALRVMKGGGSAIRKVIALKKILNDLDSCATIAGLVGNSEIEQGEADIETAGMMGDMGAIEEKIGEIKMGIGQLTKAESVVCLVGKRMVEIMMQMVLDDL